MDVKLDPNWLMDISIGGFVGHVNNNETQRYSYSSNEENPLVAIRLNKKGQWKDKYGNVYVVNALPIKFYDYNF